MTALIITVVLFAWILSAIIRTADDKRKAARQRKAEAMRRAEAARIRQEWKEQQAAAKAETARIIALEKARIEQEKWNWKQEELNRKYEEKLAKHDEEISKLKTRLDKAEADILFLQEDIETLENLRHPKAMELHNLMNLKVKDDYRGISNPARDAKIEKLTKAVRQYDKQIHSAKQKIRDAECTKSTIEAKLAA